MSEVVECIMFVTSLLDAASSNKNNKTAQITLKLFISSSTRGVRFHLHGWVKQLSVFLSMSSIYNLSERVSLGGIHVRVKNEEGNVTPLESDMLRILASRPHFK